MDSQKRSKVEAKQIVFYFPNDGLRMSVIVKQLNLRFEGYLM